MTEMDAAVLDTNDNIMALSGPQSLAVGMARVEIDQQVTTARAYPRSIKQVTDRIFSLATLDQESAEESMYALPRGGKPITGPSIRFAEVVKQAYGNCRAAARVVHVDRDEKYVEAEGVFHDLETNVATTARVRRRIVDSRGKLYSDDMIIVTGNAACSIALRNAIMGGVPKPLWRRAYEAVQGAIKGDITTLVENRGNAIKAFAVFGVKPEQIYPALGVQGVEDITVEHIPVLRGMFGTLKNGEATVEEMFGSMTAPSPPPQTFHAGFSDADAPPKPKAAKAKKADKEPEPEPEVVKEPEPEVLAPVEDEAQPVAEEDPDLTRAISRKEIDEAVAKAQAVNDAKAAAAEAEEREEHDAAIEEATGASEPEEDDDGMPPELKVYVDALEESPSWDATKLLMRDFYTGAFFKGLKPDQQNRIRGNTWAVCLENKTPGLPDQAGDVSAFRLWIEWIEDADAIDGTLRALEQEDTFSSKADDFKDAIRQAAKVRAHALRGG